MNDSRRFSTKPTRLTDADYLPFNSPTFGQEPLGEIPDSYFRWFLAQSWCDKYPDLVDYANLVIDDPEDS